jgi:type II secretory pathway component PulF
VRSQSSVLAAVLLPLMFLIIVSFAGVFILAMMLPFISLIQKLSG